MDNDVLRQAPLFSGLDDEAAESLGSQMSATRLRRGEVLFHEGDEGDRLYIVTDGKIKLGRSSADGRENLLAILGPGQMFGELSLFDPGPRSATATAVTDEVLRQAPLFSGLDEESAAVLETSMASSSLKRGDVLFNEGDDGSQLYIVTEGKVKLGRSSADGRENLLAILGPGQMFGELSLFDPGPRSATVTAVTDTAFFSLSHDDLLKWLDGRPDVANGLLSQLASRLRRANDVVADLVFSDVPGRVAKALLDLASRFGRKADDGIHVNHDLTQEELAQLVGASRETVNKALADFASRGWMRLEPRSVVILDLERLQRRAR